MKRIISLFLICIMLLTGCGVKNINSDNKDIKEIGTSVEDNHDNIEDDIVEIDFPTLDDENLISYLESSVYTDLIDKLDSDEYFIEDISVKYISKEYLEEVEYNSQSNIYFGFTLEELEEQFGDEKFVFTLGEDGKTTVKEFEAYDDTYDKVLRNVVNGAGVVLISATVSATTGGVAPAVSVIFAASAKTGTIVGLSDGVISGVIAGAVTGVQTKDFDEAIKAAALAGSEGFKWGAISGVALGGATKALELKGLTQGGLSLNDAAIIQRESKCSPEFIRTLHSMEQYRNLDYPTEILRSLHSIDEYNVFKELKLKAQVVNGKMALVQDVDMKFIGNVADGRTNAERIKLGVAPLDSSGKSYNLHHIGQKQDSPIAILTDEQHKYYSKILHSNTGQASGVVDHGASFLKQKRAFWKTILENSNE